MQSIVAEVIVTVSLDKADVAIGNSAELWCHYTAVTDPSLLVVNWEYKVHGDATNSGIWTYERNTSDAVHAGVDRNKFERIETDVTREHAIRLKNAMLQDEGDYICKVEYYGNNYSEKINNAPMTILGT